MKKDIPVPLSLVGVLLAFAIAYRYFNGADAVSIIRDVALGIMLSTLLFATRVFGGGAAKLVGVSVVFFGTTIQFLLFLMLTMFSLAVLAKLSSRDQFPVLPIFAFYLVAFLVGPTALRSLA